MRLPSLPPQAWVHCPPGGTSWDLQGTHACKGLRQMGKLDEAE